MIAMHNLKEFATSSNGDRWFLGRNEQSSAAFVLHRGNPASGGHETRSTVDSFLAQEPRGPQHDRLAAVLAAIEAPETADGGEEEKTPSLKLAEEYLRLGGKRRAKVDDNIVNTRLWEDEPKEASEFWDIKVEPMEEKQRREVELHLPSISDD